MKMQTVTRMTGLGLALLFLGTAHAATHEMRLIDTGNGQPFWADAAKLDSLSEKSHLLNRCGGYFDITNVSAAQNQINQTQLPLVEEFKLSLKNRVPTQQTYLNQVFPELDNAKIIETVKSLAAYKNRYYQSPYGVKAAEWIASQFKERSGSRADAKIELFQHKFKQPSVIATIPGQGPHANEIVVIGGHEDSINISSIFGSPEQVAPGADDNATGVATILEVYRVMIASGFKNDRTLSFMTYAGEEKGLLGSQDIANRYKKDGKSVVAVVQFDMTGFDGSNDQVVFMTDFTNADLTKFTQVLMDTYVKSRWSNDKCGYACSDHASWFKAGYPSVMPFEATMGQDNKKIHTQNDVIDILDFNHSLHFTKLALAFAAELSTEK